MSRSVIFIFSENSIEYASTVVTPDGLVHLSRTRASHRALPHTFTTHATCGEYQCDSPGGLVHHFAYTAGSRRITFFYQSHARQCGPDSPATYAQETWVLCSVIKTPCNAFDSLLRMRRGSATFRSQWSFQGCTSYRH